MCNKSNCESLSLSLSIFLLTDLFARKLQLPWAAGQGLSPPQYAVSFKLRNLNWNLNRNLTLALIFKSVSSKISRAKAAKKTRKYFKIVTFGELWGRGTTAASGTSFRCPLSAALACICCGYAKDATSLFGISNEPQWVLPHPTPH